VIRLLVAEGDAPTRAGLRVALTRAGFDVVAEAAGHAAAVDAAVTERPDVVLVAADLPEGGIDTAARIAEALAGARIVVLSSNPGGDELVAAVLAGAAGYLAKNMALDRLPHALRGVVEGEVALPRRHASHLLEEFRNRDVQRSRVSQQVKAALTDREWDVLRLLGEDASTAQMAHRLGISQVTVRRHVSRMLAKLALPDRESAAALLRRSGN
jgi:RNA polymerase sigma factor (sigma-70 family)